MMKYFYTFLLLTVCFSGVKAQKKSDVYFLKNNGQIVNHIDSADFIRIIREPDSGFVHYELLEYYKNKNPKRMGHTGIFNGNLYLEGRVREFYPDNVLKEISYYKDNKLIGLSKRYHENGNLYERRNYIENTDKNNYGSGYEHIRKQYATETKDNHLVEYVGDTLGNSFLDTVGTGAFKVVFRSGDIQEGSYKKGLRNGNWKTFSVEDSSTVEEIYESGKFVQGKRTEKDGKYVEYTQKEILPEFKGGLNKFMNFLYKNMNYPKEAKDKNIQGRVFVNFVVEEDGSLTNIKAAAGVGGGCKEEAVRVVSLSPKWNPGMRDGKSVKMNFTLPIVFSLGRR